MKNCFLCVIVLIACLFVSFRASAQTQNAPIPGSGQYNVSISTVTTLIVPNNGNYGKICVTGTATYTTDGTTPSATVGLPTSNTCLQLSGYAVLKALKIFGASATMSVDYQKQ
jgi:hypothetical protein